MSPPVPTIPPPGAWSSSGTDFHKDSHFCSHCKGEIRPGGKLWFKSALVLCMTCFPIFFKTYRN